LTVSTLNTEELLLLCKNKNQTAQFEIYNRYSKAMFNVAYRIVKDQHYAEDVMQEGFLKVFNNIDAYKNEVAFGAWLKKIIVNTSIDFYKKNTKFKPEDLTDTIHKIEEVDQYQCENLDFTNLRVQQVIEAMNTLKASYSVILTLFFIEGYDQEEISEIMNISYANCRTTLSRAKDCLRLKLMKI
jgi:RNA polymerase sigma-70 factor (ECF subfamily)